ncbi:MAG: hypothetical protein PHX44_03210 [Sulfurimonas sp.]|uniref:hypothetical protein n=1 Tax=Sulfurimonas sp. TaxID=2022749 RepID=UPI0026135495|nr:hypothetical protein [Sulfurimonas sp.]MDD2652041.1 hypothetical protein [Sulfurimonas sp.]MDD3452050.1 hypothetical protein [Sulfurimonas sp.]
MWLGKLKIAVVEGDVASLQKLLGSVPQLKEKEEMQEALYLLKEATFQIQKLKDETLISMQQMKKNIAFLHSTDSHSFKNLDIRL